MTSWSSHFGNMIVLLKIINMDEQTMSRLLMCLYNLHLDHDYTSFVTIEPTFELIFEDELCFVD